MKVLPLNIHINKTWLVGSFILFVLIKFAGDVLLFSLISQNSLILLIWKTASFVVIIIPLILYIFTIEYDEKKIYSDVAAEDFFSDLSRLLLYYLSLFVINVAMALSQTLTESQSLTRNKIITVLLSDFFSVILVTCSLLTLYTIIKWLFVRRHKLTKTYVSIIVTGLVFLVLAELVSLNDISTYLYTFFTVLKISLAVMVFIAAYKTNWIAHLQKRLKYRLLWISLLGLILGIYLTSYSLNENTTYNKSLVFLLPGSQYLAGISFLYMTVYFLRLLISTILFIPAAKIVERKSSDVSSLSYLNRVISDQVSLDNLLNIVTKLAHNSCQADSTWIELYKSDSTITFPSYINTDENKLRYLHKYNILTKLFQNVNEPVLYDSKSLQSAIASQTLTGSQNLTASNSINVPSEVTFDVTEMQSLIIVPLCAGKDRIGSLVVTHHDEYSFEPNDLELLTAYKDNICIALENARLAAESLEKEHYKRELQLAQEMQKKLLPQQVPVINNYSIAAFSIASDEVGGDYYDFVKLKDGSFGILIGDVSGKGMNAAFYMAQLKGIVMSAAAEAIGAADLLKRINRILSGNIDKQMFITLSIVVLNDSDNLVKFARAGHTPAIYKFSPFEKGGQSGISEVIIKEILPNGIGINISDSTFFDSNLEEIELKLNTNGILLLFTDGVNELNAYSGYEYGIEALKEFVSKFHDSRHSDPERSEGEDSLNISVNFNESIKNELKQFLGNNKQHDDMTIVTIIRRS